MGNMSLVYPTNHGSTDIWDTILVTLFDLVQDHDHTTGKGVKVPSAGLKINADVSWSFAGTNYAITDAKIIDLAPVAAASIASYSSAIFANSSDSNNLYFRNSSGTNVRITNGSTLDITIVGGIGGDYTSVGALVDFDDASDSYRFRQQVGAAVRQYAKMQVADVHLFEYKASGVAPVPTNAVRLKSPAALAASYDVTWPAAVPGTQSMLQMSTAGVLSASNTLSGNTFKAADFLFSSVTSGFVAAMESIDPNGTHTKLLGGSSGMQVGWTLAASANGVGYPLRLRLSDRITGFTFYARKTSAAGTITARLYKHNMTDGTDTALGSGATNSANNPGYIQLAESGLTETVTVGFQYYLKLTPTGNAGDSAFGMTFEYDHP